MLGGFLALFLYTAVNRKAMREFFGYGSYYVMLLIFGIWTSQTFLLLKDTGFSLADFLQRHWFGIVVAFSITLFVFAFVQVGFKTLSAATNLSSIANSMLNDKPSYNGTMWKRPLMFALIVFGGM